MLFLLFVLAGCNPSPPYQQPVTYQQPVQVAPAPMVIQQAAPQSSGMGDLVTGAAIGALATHALSRPAAAPAPASTHVIQRTTIIKTVVQQPPKPVVAATPPPKPAAPPPAPKPSYAPTYRATPTVSYRPTVSARR